MLVDIERVPNLDSLLERMDRRRPPVPLLGRLGRPGRHRHASRPVGAVAREPRHARRPARAPPAVGGEPARLRSAACSPTCRRACRTWSIPLTPCGRSTRCWYRKAPKHASRHRDAHGFFHPLDMVGSGTACTAAPASSSTSSSCRSRPSTRCARSWPRSPTSGDASSAHVLKRLGAESGGMLSFPTAGLDAHRRLRRRRQRAAAASSTNSIGSCSTPAGGTISPRTPRPARRSSAPATHDSTSGRRFAPGSIPTAGGRATRRADSTCSDPRESATAARHDRTHVNNAIKQPQTILVLGGGSDIGQAIVHELASPALRTVILAGRRTPIELTTPLRRCGLGRLGRVRRARSRRSRRARRGRSPTSTVTSTS